MKKFIAILFFSLIALSCKTTIYNHKADCEMSKENLFDGLTGLLIEKGFEIKTSNPDNGLLLAQTMPDFNAWSGANITKSWTIKVNKNNEVSAIAKVTSTTQNAFGAVINTTESYLGDKTSTDEDWYWDIRAMLEDLCKSSITIVETKK